MNSVEHTELFEVQQGSHRRFVDGLSFEIRMQLLSITYLLLLIPSAGSRTGLRPSSNAGMLKCSQVSPTHEDGLNDLVDIVSTSLRATVGVSIPYR